MKTIILIIIQKREKAREQEHQQVNEEKMNSANMINVKIFITI